MTKTPGLIIPSLYPSIEAFEKNLRQRAEAAGFMPFEASNFIDDFFEHVGVKGMHWGVRKQKQLDTLNRISSGKGKTLETLRFKANVSMIELAANKGDFKKIASGRAAILSAQKNRIESGNATKMDKLDRALNTSIIDLARGR